MKNLLLLLLTIILCVNSITSQNLTTPIQKLSEKDNPSLTPVVFAPGIVSKEDRYEFGIAFTKNYEQVFYGVRVNDEWDAKINHMTFANGEWKPTENMNYINNFSSHDPLVKGDKLFFISTRTLNNQGDPKDSDIWTLDITKNDWTNPVNAGRTINSDKNEYYISTADNGTIYFASNANAPDTNEWDYDFYYSKFVHGEYQTPVRLSDAINSPYFDCDAYVAPDESYIIFCSSRPGGFGAGDLYISFKDSNGKWLEAQNMGEVINSDSHEFCPFVTDDGKYFFYTSRGDIYWVSAEILSQIKNDLFSKNESGMNKSAEKIIEQYWDAANKRDWDVFKSLLSDEFTYILPQSKEKISGKELFTEFNAMYPGDWTLEMVELVVNENKAVSKISFLDSGTEQTGISFFEFTGDKINKITEYWPTEYDPPARNIKGIERF